MANISETAATRVWFIVCYSWWDTPTGGAGVAWIALMATAVAAWGESRAGPGWAESQSTLDSERDEYMKPRAPTSVTGGRGIITLQGKASSELGGDAACSEGIGQVWTLRAMRTSTYGGRAG